MRRSAEVGHDNDEEQDEEEEEEKVNEFLKHKYFNCHDAS
jgi:uncharacterized protein YgfB (UPF0149 family)